MKNKKTKSVPISVIQFPFKMYKKLNNLSKGRRYPYTLSKEEKRMIDKTRKKSGKRKTVKTR